MNDKKNPDNRPKYEAPHALRLDEINKGSGLCEFSGSGDSGDCVGNGNFAGGECGEFGNSPTSPTCHYHGSDF